MGPGYPAGPAKPGQVGAGYERAILQEVDTSTPEYRAFEKQIYEVALRRMGLRKTRAPKSERGEAR